MIGAAHLKGWRMMLVLALLLVPFSAAINKTAQAAATQMVADLSEKTVEITSDYHGTELLLFGAIDGQAGDDVVIVVTGPPTRMAQRRKDQVAGIWVNVETNIWENAPSFYHVYTTRLLDRIADYETLTAAGIGMSSLDLKVTPEDQTANIETPDMTALIGGLTRNMQDLNLWKIHHAGISLQDDTLFKARLELPENVPPGDYSIRTVHFRDGIAISQDATNMVVKKAGLSALIYRFAHDYSVFYGLFAIAFAVAAGWLAAAAFRR